MSWKSNKAPFSNKDPGGLGADDSPVEAGVSGIRIGRLYTEFRTGESMGYMLPGSSMDLQSGMCWLFLE